MRKESGLGGGRGGVESEAPGAPGFHFRAALRGEMGVGGRGLRQVQRQPQPVSFFFIPLRMWAA